MISQHSGISLYLDFDNTITSGDVLDWVIERFSISEDWRDWEAQWRDGRMSTPDCLRRQLGNLRVSTQVLLELMSEIQIDPAFPEMVRWAAGNGADLRILSDNFSPLIHAILDNHGLDSVPVFANEFELTNGRFEASFPFLDPTCTRCAHCKAQHLCRDQRRPRIFVGDGLSDVCAALVADVVFAKDSLAADLERRGLRFRRYRDLGEVLGYLRQYHDEREAYDEHR
jgi:2,3-diketo-5-methylthio-1-phosphopentane phosphatase